MRELFLQFVENELGSNFVLIACGLPATGKSGASRQVARIKGYPLFSTDLVRLEVLKDEDISDEKVAANMDKRMRVYDETFRRADDALKDNKGVILDATFFTQLLRRRAAEIAARHKRSFIIMQTECPQEVAIRRILDRAKKEDYESNALTEQAYLNNKASFEPVDLDDLKRLYPALSITHLIVDTRHDPPEDWYVINVEKRLQ
ncbi:MAG: ATP-binding protein [Dehalococcoidales bacterium]|nr:ATP-binding protein [Dehalococcoidales bacterium]